MKMKKNYLLLLLIAFVPLTGFSQITVNSVNLLDNGEPISMGYDDDVTNHLPLTVAAAATWDFTDLVTDDIDTIIFEDPSNFPGIALFPGANMGFADDSSYVFVKKDASEFVFLGSIDNYVNDKDTSFYNMKWLSFPSTMGTSYKQIIYSESETQEFGMMGIDSIRIKVQARTHSTIEGWGAVKLPNGDFDALLQVVKDQELIYVDGLIAGTWAPLDAALLLVFGTDTGVVAEYAKYTFWGNDANARFLLAEFDTSGIASAQWSPSINSGPPTTVKLNNLDETVSIYPNPASNMIYVNVPTDNVTTVEIYDVVGHLLIKENAIIGRNDINVSSLMSGVYLVSLKNRQGEKIGTNRIVIE